MIEIPVCNETISYLTKTLESGSVTVTVIVIYFSSKTKGGREDKGPPDIAPKSFS